jgi:hypothetical protein
MITATRIEQGELGAMLGQLPEALREAVERGLERATELLRAAVTALAISPLGVRPGAALGEFAGSVRTAVRADDARRFSGEVFLGAPADRYGLFVELGTRPHFPPPAALEGWVRRRLGVTEGRQAREVAFLIARKIARAGTPGHLFFQRALEQNEDRVVAMIDEELGRALAGAER